MRTSKAIVEVFRDLCRS